MHKLIPTIYFYILSLVGMVLLIIGLFTTVHYIVGVSAYPKYPLPYGNESRCTMMFVPDEKSSVSPEQVKNDCLKDLEGERVITKANDLEKSISFTLIGLAVFGIHFYFARKTKKTE